ncbi:hypothetical protein B0H21DRAFT_582301 [Amylocystis lapponica]|nr:hypothetical protein B0H21DRAFT_582301 [Amylocystis lapponica]
MRTHTGALWSSLAAARKVTPTTFPLWLKRTMVSRRTTISTSRTNHRGRQEYQLSSPMALKRVCPMTAGRHAHVHRKTT